MAARRSSCPRSAPAEHDVDRRRFLALAGMVGLSVTACGGSSATVSGASPTVPRSTPGSSTTPSASATSEPLQSTAPTRSTETAETSETAQTPETTATAEAPHVPQGSRPGPATTGVRPGVQLTDFAGKLNVTTAGTVFEGIRFTAPVLVNAPNVVFRNCLFSYGTIFAGRMVAVAPHVEGDVTGVLFEDCEFDGRGSAELILGWSGWTARRCNFHSASDGIRIGNNCLLEDSWVHHLARKGTLHPDCLQTTGGTGSVVRRCLLETANPTSGDLGNAAFQIGGETQPTSKLTIENCWLSGGNFTINVGAGTIDYKTITIRNNTFLGGWRYGPLVCKKEVIATGNVDAAGKPISINYR